MAVATAQHFGIVGNGCLFVFDVTEDGLLVPLRYERREEREGKDSRRGEDRSTYVVGV